MDYSDHYSHLERPASMVDKLGHLVLSFSHFVLGWDTIRRGACFHSVHTKDMEQGGLMT